MCSQLPNVSARVDTGVGSPSSILEYAETTIDGIGLVRSFFNVEERNAASVPRFLEMRRVSEGNQAATILLGRARMARSLRIQAPGVTAHLLSRGNNKQCIFTDAEDYEQYLDLLSRKLERFDVRCQAFCLLWNHTHLLATPSEMPLSGMMHHLNSQYCQWFNKRHRRVGHVLQGRYLSLLIDEGSYFLNALRYIMLNPVEAGKVDDPADWPWSSYRASAGLEPAPGYLDLRPVWAALGATGETDGRERFTTFVRSERYPEDMGGPLLFGSEAFARRIDPRLSPFRDNRDFIYAQRFATRPALAALLVGAAYPRGVEEAVWTAFCRYAYTLKDIGTALGIHPSTVWTWVRRAEARHAE